MERKVSVKKNYIWNTSYQVADIDCSFDYGSIFIAGGLGRKVMEYIVIHIPLQHILYCLQF